MFYWSYKEIHVVLSDDEEMALVQELGKDPLERVGYHTSRQVRKDIEQRIFRYFEQSLHADPEAFNRRYVFRSCYGKDAQRMFPVLLDAYGRITRRATIGLYGERSQLDELAENVYYATTDNVFQITLFERGRWPWAQPVVSGHISLPVSSIAKVAGTADNFFVASTAELEALFNPEQDEDGGPPTRDIPHPRLEEEHGLDLAYLETPAFMWEGSTIHPHTRVCLPDEPRLPL